MRNFSNLVFSSCKLPHFRVCKGSFFATMTNIQRNSFSQSSQDRTSQAEQIVVIEGRLNIRNSEQLQLRLLTNSQKQPISIQIPKMGQLKDIAKQLEEKLKLSANISFVCNDGFFLPDFTPTEALLNRNFYISTGNERHIPIVGQFQQTTSSLDQTIEGLQNLQFPAVMKNDIIKYIRRVDTLIHLKYSNIDINSQYKAVKQLQPLKEKNVNQLSSKRPVSQPQSYKDIDNLVTVPSSQAKKILIEALLDPTPQDRGVSQIEVQFQKLYWEIEQMKDLKAKAQMKSRKKVKNIMASGLVLIGANIGFIWTGTYLIWSWDIIQPIAYFIDAGAGILLTYQFFKMGKMYSHLNFQQYLFQKYLKQAYQDVGFDESKYDAQILRMKKLQSIIKDHYIRKLS